MTKRCGHLDRVSKESSIAEEKRARRTDHGDQR